MPATPPAEAAPSPVAHIDADTPAPTAAPAVVRLGNLIDRLAEKLQAQAPALAGKLKALASNLESGSVPAELIPGLTDDPGAASTESEIARIVEALSEPRAKRAAQPAPQPFAAPALDLPDSVAPMSEPDETPDTRVTTTGVAPAETAQPRQAEPARSALVVGAAREAEAGGDDASPAAAPALAASLGPSAPDPQAPPAQQLQTAPVARTVHAAYQAPVPQVNLPQVAFEVVRQFEAGNTRFQIRLDPPELGRIDVKLDLDKSGTVNARMTVERPETLDLMQRDQRALQQALQQAGLDTGRTNLEFSLRQNPFAQQGGMGSGGNGQPAQVPEGLSASGDEAMAAELATTTYRGTATAGGVNLFV